MATGRAQFKSVMWKTTLIVQSSSKKVDCIHAQQCPPFWSIEQTKFDIFFYQSLLLDEQKAGLKLAMQIYSEH